jgi:CRP-like cAMP-binding protein
MTTANTSELIPNRILAALPETEYQQLLPHLKKIDLPQGEILYNPGDRIEYVYFPHAGVISLVTLLKDGASVEVGVVGREGMCGISIVLGDDRAPSQAIVQIGNGGTRLKASVLHEELKRGGELRNLLQRFILASLQRTSQAAACNRNHHVGERLAFWLLTCQDSIGHNNLKLTQDFIAEMLGTRRAGVTEAAMTLQSLGLIRYSRGNINILDRPGLEEASCECYGVVRQEFDRLLNGPKSSTSI